MTKFTLYIADLEITFHASLVKIEDDTIIISGLKLIDTPDVNNIAPDANNFTQNTNNFAQNANLITKPAVTEPAVTERSRSVESAKKKPVLPANKPKPETTNSNKLKGLPAATGVKKCRECNKEYKPTSNAQVRCTECLNKPKPKQTTVPQITQGDLLKPMGNLV